jgi:pilus assembly protein FimV
LSLGSAPQLDTERELDTEPELDTETERELSLAPEPASEPARELASEGTLSLAPESAGERRLEAGPEGEFSLNPEPRAAELSMESESESPAEGGTPADLFAGFAPASKPPSAPDFSFDLATAFSIQPTADHPSDTRFDLSIDAPAVDPARPVAPEADGLSMNPVQEQVVAARPVAAPKDLAIDAAPDPVVEPAPPAASTPVPLVAAAAEQTEPDLDLDLDLEPEPESDLYVAPGPDPAVLATLARLERFLGAIQSRRADQ